MIPDLPKQARECVEKVAKRRDLDPALVFKPWPREPWIDAARAEVITKLSNLRDDTDQRFLFSHSQLAKWFGVTRVRISVYARRSPDYKSRRMTVRG